MKQSKLRDNKLIIWINKIENFIVSFLLFSILLFSVFQIILRNVFGSGIIWSDSLLRISVLWLGLIGAIIASRHGKQISIDVLSQFLSTRSKATIEKINYMLTAIICLIISYYSAQFVYLEYQDATIAFANIPSWLTEIIIPVSFFVMSIKYLTQLIIKNKVS